MVISSTVHSYKLPSLVKLHIRQRFFILIMSTPNTQSKLGGQDPSVSSSGFTRQTNGWTPL